MPPDLASMQAVVWIVVVCSYALLLLLMMMIILCFHCRATQITVHVQTAGCQMTPACRRACDIAFNTVQPKSRRLIHV